MTRAPTKTPIAHIPGLLVFSPAAKSSSARIPRCRRLAYTCLDTHCQQVLRAKHLLTSAPTKTPIAQIQKHHIRATKQKYYSGARTENNTTAERKDKRTTAKRKDKGTTAWETLVGSSVKAACAALTRGTCHTPLHEHGASPDEEKRLECARCCRARAARCCRARADVVAEVHADVWLRGAT